MKLHLVPTESPKKSTLYFHNHTEVLKFGIPDGLNLRGGNTFY
jgi:hypothetical protein